MPYYPLNPNTAPNDWDTIDYYDEHGANFGQFVQALEAMDSKGKIREDAKRILARLFFCNKPVPCSSLPTSKINGVLGSSFSKSLFDELSQFGVIKDPSATQTSSQSSIGIGLFILFMQMKAPNGEIANCWALRGRFRCALATCFDMEEWLNC